MATPLVPGTLTKRVRRRRSAAVAVSALTLALGAQAAMGRWQATAPFAGNAAGSARAEPGDEPVDERGAAAATRPDPSTSSAPASSLDELDARAHEAVLVLRSHRRRVEAPHEAAQPVPSVPRPERARPVAAGAGAVADIVQGTSGLPAPAPSSVRQPLLGVSLAPPPLTHEAPDEPPAVEREMVIDEVEAPGSLPCLLVPTVPDLPAIVPAPDEPTTLEAAERDDGGRAACTATVDGLVPEEPGPAEPGPAVEPLRPATDLGA